MNKAEIIEMLKYYTEQLENAEENAINSNIGVEKVVNNIKKDIIEEFQKYDNETYKHLKLNDCNKCKFKHGNDCSKGFYFNKSINFYRCGDEFED